MFRLHVTYPIRGRYVTYRARVVSRDFPDVCCSERYTLMDRNAAVRNVPHNPFVNSSLGLRGYVLMDQTAAVRNVPHSPLVNCSLGLRGYLFMDQTAAVRYVPHNPLVNCSLALRGYVLMDQTAAVRNVPHNPLVNCSLALRGYVTGRRTHTGTLTCEETRDLKGSQTSNSLFLSHYVHARRVGVWGCGGLTQPVRNVLS